jgi:hypothetical protein
LRSKPGTEDSLINELPEHASPKPPGNVIVTTGAIIAVLLGIPSLFIGLFSASGVFSGEKLVAGSLGTLWAYLAVVGAYELNRRKFDWERGRDYSDLHLLSGTVAASAGLIVSGAMHESMPILAIVPALSAIKQANDGYETSYRAWVHATVLATGFAIGLWFFVNGVIGKVLLERIVELP